MTHMNGLCFGLSVMLLTGCTSTMQARNIQPSGFLGENSSRLQVASEDGPVQGYRNPAVNWSAYNKILLEQVIIWDGLYAKLDKKERNDLQRLADSFHDMLSLSLSKDYELVEKPAVGTMRIQVAITHAADAWTTPAPISRTNLHLRSANTPWNFSNGRPGFEGEITVEFKVQDAQTLELLAAGVDRRVGGRTFKRDNKFFNSWSDVKNSLGFWTDQTVYRLCVLRGEASCVEPWG
jgi:Protein of unknown function (DUF3313)